MEEVDLCEAEARPVGLLVVKDVDSQEGGRREEAPVVLEEERDLEEVEDVEEGEAVVGEEEEEDSAEEQLQISKISMINWIII